MKGDGMTVLDKDTVVFNTIYINKVELEEAVFAYVRFLKDGEVGFSVMDAPYIRPDFSDCGVFWVRPEDFLRTFRPLEDDDLEDMEPLSGRSS